MTWRDRAKEVIADVRRANPGVTGGALRALLKPAYPFGERRYFPYKVWLEEVAEACGDAARKRADRQDAELAGDGLFKEQS